MLLLLPNNVSKSDPPEVQRTNILDQALLRKLLQNIH